MNRKDAIIALTQVKPELAGRFGVTTLALFGSTARDIANRESDIDILVDLDYSQKIGLQFIQMKLDLEKLLNREVDLVSSNGMSKYIKPLVDVEKRLIYEK